MYDMHFIHLEQKTQGTSVASESDCNLKAQASCFKESMLKKIDVTIDITTRRCYIVLVRCNQEGYINERTRTKKEDLDMTNKEKALALINTFTTGDTEKARELLSDGYIQHNLAFGTGADAFVAAVEGLAKAPVKTTVNNIRSFEDGDKVFLQTVYNFAGAGEQVAFDVFRFDADGKIAEHWDNLADKAEPNPSGHTQIDGTLEKKDVDKEETRRIVAGFVGDVLRGEHPEKLTSYYDGDKVYPAQYGDR